MAEVTAPSTTGGQGPVERAFRLLQTIVAADESTGVRELSRRSGLPRSTVARLVGTLADLGMVDRTADGAVLPGSALATLQPGATPPMLRDQLRPLLAELAHSFGENAALSVDDGDALLYLDQVRAENAVTVPDVTDERHPFHVVAPGLVTMSRWDDARVGSYVRGDLDDATSHTMTDPSDIRRRLATIRKVGFAWTDQELDIGVNGLAVPVLDRTGSMVATISLYGPSYRFSPDAQPGLAERLMELVAARVRSLLRT